MTVGPESCQTESSVSPVQWRADHDYSADWTESQFAENWRTQDENEIGERTPPMCSLCGVFIRSPTPPESLHDRDEERPEHPDQQADRCPESSDDSDDDDHEMDDNFHENRFNSIADESEGRDTDGDDDRDLDDGDGAILTPADVLQFFMSHHQSSILLAGESDDENDDVQMFESHRAAVECHIIEVHGAPEDYSLNPKDFFPPRPNPTIFVPVIVPQSKSPLMPTPDEIFDEVSDKFSDLKVGAVPRKTMHGWARILAQGLGRETRGLQGSLGELLHMCYELQWRKTKMTSAS